MPPEARAEERREEVTIYSSQDGAVQEEAALAAHQGVGMPPAAEVPEFNDETNQDSSFTARFHFGGGPLDYGGDVSCARGHGQNHKLPN